MTTETQASANIGEFRFGDGRHFQINRKLHGDGVRLDRQYPDPEKGQCIATGSKLDSPEPEFRFPGNWSTAERHHARVSITNAWARSQRSQNEAEADEPAGRTE